MPLSRCSYAPGEGDHRHTWCSPIERLGEGENDTRLKNYFRGVPGLQPPSHRCAGFLFTVPLNQTSSLAFYPHDRSACWLSQNKYPQTKRSEPQCCSNANHKCDHGVLLSLAWIVAAAPPWCPLALRRWLRYARHLGSSVASHRGYSPPAIQGSWYLSRKKSQRLEN